MCDSHSRSETDASAAPEAGTHHHPGPPLSNRLTPASAEAFHTSLHFSARAEGLPDQRTAAGRAEGPEVTGAASRAPCAGAGRESSLRGWFIGARVTLVRKCSRYRISGRCCSACSSTAAPPTATVSSRSSSVGGSAPPSRKMIDRVMEYSSSRKTSFSRRRFVIPARCSGEPKRTPEHLKNSCSSPTYCA